MKTNTRILVAATVLLTSGLSQAALTSGQTIGVAFGSDGSGSFGNVIAGNFTGVHENMGVNALSDMVLLSDGTTGSGITYSSQIISGIGFSNGDPGFGSGATSPFSDLSLDHWSGVYGGSPSSFQFTFSGLDDSLTYDLTLAIGSWTTNNSVDNVLVTSDGQSVNMGDLDAEPVYQTLTGLSTDGSGNLVIDVSNSTSGVAALSAATLTAAVPEPSSFMLLSIGFTAIIMRRKR